MWCAKTIIGKRLFKHHVRIYRHHEITGLVGGFNRAAVPRMAVIRNI